MKELIEQIQKNRIEGEIIRFISSLEIMRGNGVFYRTPSSLNTVIHISERKHLTLNTNIRYYLKELFGDDPLKFDEILLDYIQKTFKPRRIIYESFY